MAETEGEPQKLDQDSKPQTPPKRKPDLDTADGGEDQRTMKQQKTDAPLKDPGDAGQAMEKKEIANQNGNAANDKVKSVFSVEDKGKGKMVVVEEENSDNEEDGQGIEDSSHDGDSSNEENSDGLPGGDGDDEGSDFSDDPLAEVDLDNILPSRTRRRRPVEPGAYLVEDRDDDDDEDSE